MFISTTIGIVVDNLDPDKMHRIKVKFVTDSVQGLHSKSSWCRMMSPMAGANRGLVILPDVGTEVLIGFAFRSMSPYILGAVYNGEDLPEPYRNDDCLNNVRVFWSRGDHMVTFDDTDGHEKVGFGAQAPTRLDPSSAGIHAIMDSSQKTMTSCSDGDTEVEAVQTISIKCKHFKLNAENSIDLSASKTITVGAQTAATIEGSTTAEFKAALVKLNPAAPAPVPASAIAIPAHKHPPAVAGLVDQACAGASQVTAATGEDQGGAGGPVAGSQAGTDGKETSPWDELRDKTKDSLGDAVGDTVGDMLGDKAGELAEKLAEKAVDAAFDAAEDAVADAFSGIGGGGRPGDGGGPGGRPGGGGGPGGRPGDGGGPGGAGGSPGDGGGPDDGEDPATDTGSSFDGSGLKADRQINPESLSPKPRKSKTPKIKSSEATSASPPHPDSEAGSSSKAKSPSSRKGSSKPTKPSARSRSTLDFDIPDLPEPEDS